MRILSEYLKYRIKILLLFLTAFAFPALTLSLYDLPTEPVLYAFALSGTVLAVSAVFDFVLFVRRHRRLSRVLLSVDADISVLPPPRNLPEEDLYPASYPRSLRRSAPLNPKRSARSARLRIITPCGCIRSKRRYRR